MSTTMKAAVHLGPNYNEDFVAYMNTKFLELRTFFDITQRLILDQAFEILNVSTIIWRFSPWMRSTLLHDRAIGWTGAKVHVHPDSVLCLGRCMIIQKRMRNGEIKLKISNKTTLSENNLESMENLSSCGTFSQDVQL